MRDKDQKFIFNDDEISLIKNTFSGDDTLLYTVRKVLLQFPMTDAERGLIKLSITPEVLKVLRKRILPEIGDEFPLYQLSSLYANLGEALKIKTPEDALPHIKARAIAIQYLSQQFVLLGNIDAIDAYNAPSWIELTSLGNVNGDAEHDYINLNAYLFLLAYIDPTLGQIKSIAGAKEETVEQAKKRMDKDSTQ